MIQRIQTIWFLLAAACGFTTLRLSFYSGNIVLEGTQGYKYLNASNGNLILLILTVAVAITSLILIFLYKDRKMQMRLTIVNLIVSIVNIVLYFLEIKNFVPGQSSFDVTCVFAFLVPVFLFLASRGIYRDQKLIKSVDRLR